MFPEKLAVAQLINQLISFYESERLITVVTEIRHFSLCEANINSVHIFNHYFFKSNFNLSLT
jgi:hypothetical protein